MPNTIVINDGGEITVRELNDEEKAMNAEMAETFDLDLGMERAMRDALLAESDWTQYAEDNTLTDEKKAEWATYRQTLRDRFTDKTRVSQLDPWPAPPS